MKRLFLFAIVFVGLLLFTQCKSGIRYAEKSVSSELYREVPYQQYTHKKNPKGVVLLLPDYPDTLNIGQSAIVQLLKKEGYDLLVVDKPGDDRDTKISLDTRDGRIKDVIALYKEEVFTKYDNTILLGIGEGGYVVPALRNQLKPTKSIVININPYSRLAAYEQWVNSDSLTSHQWQIIHQMNLISQEELHEKVVTLKSNTSSVDVLTPNSNRQWMSYFENPVLKDLYTVTPPLYWINFEQYPTISAAHQKEAALYCSSLAASYISIPGKGNLNDEEQMEMLIEKLKKVLAQ